MAAEGDAVASRAECQVTTRPDARLAELFERAISSPPQARSAILAEVSTSDPGLARELAALLSAHDTADDFFDKLGRDVIAPAVAAVALDESGPMLLTRLQTALAGTYNIESELVGGGMSRVFVATEERFARKVVIKVLPPEMSVGVSVERFRQEIRVSARLQHPHIVPVLASDAADGLLYYVMPYVEGETLRARITRAGALPLGDALAIWRDVLDALGFAHQNGVVHRDVKPENILLSGRNALVADFGIARAIQAAAEESDNDANVAAQGVTLGTPSYMAPEQVSGDDNANHRVDIYAAGLVMYEMLTGRSPFAGINKRETIQAQLTQTPPPITRADVPSELTRLVLRCLEKSPEARPGSAESILQLLERGFAEHAGGASRRRDYALIAAVILAAVVLFAGSAYVVRQRGISSSQTAFAGNSRGIQNSQLVGPAVRGRGYTSNVAAYEWYVRGMDLALMRSDSGARRALSYFQRAIAADSNFAAAHAGLVRAYLQIGNGTRLSDRHLWVARAETAALKAVALDDSLADAHAALGWVRLVNSDYARGETEFKKAIALDPNAPRVHEGLARLYMMTARPSEQLTEARLGLKSDPYSHSAIREVALALMMNGRCEEALQLLKPLKSLTPPAGVAGIISGQCYASMEKWPEAIAEYQWAMANASGASGPAFLAHALARAGREKEARQILSELLTGRKDSHGAFGIGVVYAGLGEYDQAFVWLNKAADDGSLTAYIVEPMFADLHRDPRYPPLRQRLQYQNR